MMHPKCHSLVLAWFFLLQTFSMPLNMDSYRLLKKERWVYVPLQGLHSGLSYIKSIQNNKLLFQPYPSSTQQKKKKKRDAPTYGLYFTVYEYTKEKLAKLKDTKDLENYKQHARDSVDKTFPEIEHPELVSSMVFCFWHVSFCVYICMHTCIYLCMYVCMNVPLYIVAR